MSAGRKIKQGSYCRNLSFEQLEGRDLLALINPGDIVFNTENSIRRVNGSTGQLTTLTSDFEVNGEAGPGLAVRGNGDIYYVSEESLRKWSSNTGTVSTVLSVPQETSLAAGPAGELVVAKRGATDSIVRYAGIFSTPQTIVSGVDLGGDDDGPGLAVAPDGDIYFVVNNADFTSRIDRWDSDSKSTAVFLSGVTRRASLAFGPSGEFVVADFGPENDTIQAYLPNSTSVQTTISVPDNVPEGEPPTGSIWDNGLNGHEGGPGVAVAADGDIYFVRGYYIVDYNRDTPTGYEFGAHTFYKIHKWDRQTRPTQIVTQLPDEGVQARLSSWLYDTRLSDFSNDATLNRLTLDYNITPNKNLSFYASSDGVYSSGDTKLLDVEVTPASIAESPFLVSLGPVGTKQRLVIEPGLGEGTSLANALLDKQVDTIFAVADPGGPNESVIAFRGFYQRTPSLGLYNSYRPEYKRHCDDWNWHNFI